MKKSRGASSATQRGPPHEQDVSSRKPRARLMPRKEITTPVVFVHGAFCGGWAFDAFREPFEAAGFETHAPNLPHHERGADLEALSQIGLKEYSEAIATYALELRAPPVLVGHSLGGLVVQLAAAKIPVTGLV